MEKEWDLIVIGGGAAGFFGAIAAAEASVCPLKIAIFEKSTRVLGKVKISGGGRCNVTHHCFVPKELTTHYPRGGKTLIGPFHHFGPQETTAWFADHGVDLKTEDDGRMFPETNTSQSVIDCLQNTAAQYGIEVVTSCGVSALKRCSDQYVLTLKDEEQIKAGAVLIATGGTRSAASARLAEQLGHELIPPVPSLFTFHCKDPRLEGLEGLSVRHCELSIEGKPLRSSGPVLVTHWGLSGPGILKLSALGARLLAEENYTFTLQINWCPELDLKALFQLKRQEWGKKQLVKRSPLAALPKRLWESFCTQLGLSEGLQWSQLGKNSEDALIATLQKGRFEIVGKSMNKEEFVTCGGVNLRDVSFKTLESRLSPRLYFAGEILDIDGVTGGFNFQNAWTTAYLAGRAAAECSQTTAVVPHS